MAKLLAVGAAAILGGLVLAAQQGTTPAHSQVFDTFTPGPCSPNGGLHGGCNPGTLPSCANVTATDNCGTPNVVCAPGAITGGCNKSQTFTYTATDACGNSAVGTATYTWKEDTTNPVLDEEEFAAFLARVTERFGSDVAAPAFPAGEGRTKTSAAWLIDKSGFTKGYGSGRARISTKHTLALTNRGAATTEDLLALAREVVAGVRDAFGITLVNEPVTVGVSL